MDEENQTIKREESDDILLNGSGLKSEFWLFIWEVLKIVIISLAIIVPVRYYLAQPFFVKGASMEPTLEDGDYLIINEISYRLEDPQRGDIIVFRFPNDPSQFFIKRIVGLPDETIELKRDKIFIYNAKNPAGIVLDEKYLAGTYPLGPDLKLKLDDNEYFVLGDNRSASSDSRFWGPVNKSLIVGRAWVRAWPVKKAARFTPVVYP